MVTFGRSLPRRIDEAGSRGARGAMERGLGAVGNFHLPLSTDHGPFRSSGSGGQLEIVGFGGVRVRVGSGQGVLR